MNVLCSDKTGTLTLNKLTVDKALIEVFAKGVDADHVLLLAARASRTENQDSIDAAIVGTLADPKEVRCISFLFFILFYSFRFRGCERDVLGVFRPELVLGRCISSHSTLLTRGLL